MRNRRPISGPWAKLTCLGIIAVMLASCGGDQEAGEDSAEIRGTSVYTVNYPLQYMTQRIAGDHLSVTFPMSEEGDPAFWNPSAEDVTAFQQADLILRNGADYAQWTVNTTLPES